MVRYKKRYIILKVYFEDKKVDDTMNTKDLFNALKDSLLENFGDFGIGTALQNLTVKYFNPKTSTAIVQSAIEYYRQVWAAATYVRKICGRSCMVTSVHVTGTLRSCEKFILQSYAYELRKIRGSITGTIQDASKV